jgi:hypothetical protein
VGRRGALPQIPRKPCLKNVWAGRVLFFPSSNIAAPHTNHSKSKKISSASPELDYRQKSARQRWIKAECPQMNKAEISQRMAELRGWLLAYFHRDQRYLVVPGSAASDVVVAHEEQKVMTKAPDIVPTLNPGFLCAKPAACPGHAKAVPEASHEDWMVGSSPILGSAATLGVKRVCVNGKYVAAAMGLVA